MSSKIVFWLFLLGIPAIIVIYAIAIYNRLVELKNRFKNAFSQIDVQLQRRYELIPNLVEVAKKYMAHERETLEAVIAARNQAQAAAQAARAQPDDGNALGALAGAETLLGGALGRLFALAEDYPDLKANENMMQLNEEMVSTENRVSFARQAFNDAVMAYNTRCESFPDVLLARHFGFARATLLALEDEQAKKAVRISFD